MTLEQALPLLVGPVAAGHSDMTLAQHTDYVSAALHVLVVSTRMCYTEPPTLHMQWWSLGLLSYPLTLSTSGGGNVSVFCLHKAMWMKGTLRS